MALTAGIQNAGEICRYESSESSTLFTTAANNEWNGLEWNGLHWNGWENMKNVRTKAMLWPGTERALS